jgi:hypothetical protein
MPWKRKRRKSKRCNKQNALWGDYPVDEFDISDCEPQDAAYALSLYVAYARIEQRKALSKLELRHFESNTTLKEFAFRLWKKTWWNGPMRWRNWL